jgi:hypothetical protein
LLRYFTAVVLPVTDQHLANTHNLVRRVLGIRSRSGEPMRASRHAKGLSSIRLVERNAYVTVTFEPRS